MGFCVGWEPEAVGTEHLWHLELLGVAAEWLLLLGVGLPEAALRELLPELLETAGWEAAELVGCLGGLAECALEGGLRPVVIGALIGIRQYGVGLGDLGEHFGGCLSIIRIFVLSKSHKPYRMPLQSQSPIRLLNLLIRRILLHPQYLIKVLLLPLLPTHIIYNLYEITVNNRFPHPAPNHHPTH